ncbi:MAG: hypothetical protein JNL76_00005 [Alphaproteobacteria bacterium]|nr:hypothetical protein [Alphaproteobacteria bacterium]
MKKLIPLILITAVVAVLAFKCWDSLTHAKYVVTTNFAASPQISVLKLENFQFSFKKYELIKFAYDKDFTPEAAEFVPITLCHVRGFPLRSPLFESKIKQADLEQYRYFWKQNLRDSKPYNKQTLIAIDPRSHEGWLLQTPWLSTEFKINTLDDLLKWQKDPFWAKKGCTEMGI